MYAAQRPLLGTEWLAADPAQGGLSATGRRETALADLFLPADGRLRDDDRATIARLMIGLIDSIERDLRGRLVPALVQWPALVESLAAPRTSIAAPILTESGALRDSALVEVLARRSEEGRVVAALWRARDRSSMLDSGSKPNPLAGLADDYDSAVARAAIALRDADHSRRDAVGAPVLASAELPAEGYHRLVWRVAAALRSHIMATGMVTAALVDPLIARAADGVLAGYDEGETLAELALALARTLRTGGRLDDTLIVDALAAGHAGFAVAALAVRAGITFDAAWDMVFDHGPWPSRLLLLCRAADVAPAHAADLALRLARDDGDDEVLADLLDAYDTTPSQQAAAAIALWRLDPTYLASIAELARVRPR